MDKTSSDSNSDSSTPRKKNGSKKKRKLSRRQSYRLRKKMILSKIKSQTADRSYLNTICVTRTVELPSTRNIGEEKSKLLFMLAIGLNPKPETTQNLPRIKMQKLDQSTLSKAKAKTRERIFEMCRKREVEALRQRTSQFLTTTPIRTRAPKDNVELVNLVSDDEGGEDEEDQNNEIVTQQQPIRNTGPRLLHVNGSSSSCMDTDYEDLTIIPKVSTPRLRSVKPLLSKMEQNDKMLYQKWKETIEPLTKVVDGKIAKERDLPPLNPNGCHRKLMAANQPASLPLTVRNQVSDPVRSGGRLTGGVYKTQNNGLLRNGATSSPITPENLIIIELD